MATIKKPMPYSAIANLVKFKNDDPFYTARLLGSLIAKGKLSLWESSRFYTETEPCYAPAGLKRPKDWKQPKRTVQ